MSGILVTGASGFVGTAFCRHLLQHRIDFRTLTRPQSVGGSRAIYLEEIGNYAFECVVHLAGKAHVFGSTQKDTLEFQRSIVDYALKVADRAFSVGIRRFIFVSSVGVYGLTSSDEPISEETIPNPAEPYAEAKLKAERLLAEVAESYSAELVILRPPLIYGDFPPGNLERLSKLVKTGVPLPFGCAVACRTMLDVNKLSEALVLAAYTEKAANRIYNVSDSCGVSTRDLVLAMSAALGTKMVLFKVAGIVFYCALTLLRRKKVYNQLFEPYELDSTRIKAELGWEAQSEPLKRLSNIMW